MPADPSTLDIAEKMHLALAGALLKRVQNGEATAADLNVARQFLKDNNISVSNAKKNPALGELAEVLPFDAETEETTAEQQ